MATNIPPHNLGEVIDATIFLIDNPEASVEDLIGFCPAPDFPTGGIILGRTGATSAMLTGRGSVVIRGKAEFEEIRAGREAIIISEIPYQVNKAHMVEKIAELVRDKKIEGISDLRDESDKSGVRVVVEIKKDIMPSIVLNQLYKFTPLQTSFGCNMLALHHGRPRTMNLRDVLEAFVKFREEVLVRRTNFLLGKARDKAHVLIGLSIAVANIDEIILVIRQSPDPAVAKEELMTRNWDAANVKPLIELVDDHHNEIIDGRCKLTETQAKAILDMRLSKLTGLEQEKINGELRELGLEIQDYLDILGSRERLLNIMKDGLLKIKEEFATERKTAIEASEFEEDIEDLIQKEDMVVTVTVGGYIKRVPLSTFRAQRRGGKGRAGLSMKDEDATSQVFVTNTHTPMLFFTTSGKAFKLKTYKLPLGSPQSKGRALVNILPLEQGETINVIMPLPEDEKSWENYNMIFCTSKGNIRRNLLSDFESVRANGKIAMKLDEEGETLVGVSVCEPTDHVLLAARSGKALRCPVDTVRVFKGRNSTGVRGMMLEKGDAVISMTIVNNSDSDVETRDKYLKIDVEQRLAINACESELDISNLPFKLESELAIDTIFKYAKAEQFILTITENGYGKRTSAYEYRTTNRGGKGIINIVTSERNGDVVASLPVREKDQVMLITNSGKLIRTPIHDVRIAGRNTQGVTLFKVADKEKVVSCAHISAEAAAGDGEGEGDVDDVVSLVGEVGSDNVAVLHPGHSDAESE